VPARRTVHVTAAAPDGDTLALLTGTHATTIGGCLRAAA
jgi:hypothetical protein